MKAMVFTDLDGTLLDHDSYSFEPAREALDTLRRHDIPLVLSTSKTAAEVEPLHAALALGSTPVIVENGSGIYDPRAGREDDDSAYRKIRAALDDLPADLRSPFEGFGDMDVAGVVTHTGLMPEAAALARQRCHSEPGLWRGTVDAKTRFIAALAEKGITARQGGRFLTLSHGRTKADAMREVAASYGPDVTIALGDAPNDIEMLETADYGVIVRNDHATPLPPLAGEAAGRIQRTEHPGPEGWNTAVLRLLAKTGAI